MPLTGVYGWKDDDLSAEERIDHFFNLIDHAVEGGVPLKDLYTREHVKDFMCYVLRRSAESCKNQRFDYSKDLHMPKLKLTSTFASSVIVGDPGILIVTLPPKETRSIDVTDVQLRQLMPQLEKLKAANWLNYSVSDQADTAVKIVAAPEPVKVVEEVKVETKPAPSAPPPPAPSPEPVVAESSAPEPEADLAVPAPAPSAPKPQSYDKKNRR